MDFDLTKGFWEQERSKTDLFKAYNIIDLQEASLTYNSESGIDREYFFDSEVPIKKESFFNYVSKRLMEQQVSVAGIIQSLADFKFTGEIQIDKKIIENEGLF